MNFGLAKQGWSIHEGKAFVFISAGNAKKKAFSGFAHGRVVRKAELLSLKGIYRAIPKTWQIHLARRKAP